MARTKRSPIEELAREPYPGQKIGHGSYKEPLEGVKARQESDAARFRKKATKR